MMKRYRPNNDFTVINISYYVECHSLSHGGIISNSAKNNTDGSLIKGLIDGLKWKQFISTYSYHNRSYKKGLGYNTSSQINKLEYHKNRTLGLWSDRTMSWMKFAALLVTVSVCLGCWPVPKVDQTDYCFADIGEWYIFSNFFWYN